MSDTSDTKDKQQRIAEARRKLLQQRLKAKSASADEQQTAAPTIPSRPADAPPQASFGQVRLWYVQQVQPQSVAYNMVNAVEIRGAVDADALERSVQHIVNRHETLRTSFTQADETLLQEIHDEITISLERLTLTDADDVQAVIRQQARQPFNLATAPLMRVTLLQQAPDAYILLTVVHHIVSDEWSLGVFWDELAAAYAAFSQGDVPQLAPLPLQYADFAHWQRQQAEAGAFETSLAYWRDELSGELPLLQLPTDRPRPPVQQFEGHLLEKMLSPALSAHLREFSRQQNTTLFMTLLAAFQVLLHRYSGQADVLVGTPVANRQPPALEKLIGFFLNTLVMRADFSEDKTFVEHLQRTRQQSLAALKHQDVPFDTFIEALNPPRDPSYNPLFQTMFVYQDNAAHQPHLADNDVTPLTIDMGVSKFDLTLFAQDTDRGVRLGAEYSSALFDAPTIERLLVHYATLLESIIDAPQTSVRELNLLPEAERHMLLHTWTDTTADFPREATVHSLIAAHPADAVAVQSADETLTYGDLDTRATQLAHALGTAGITPGTPVGLCVERSAEMLVGIMGILKAGGAYVPIDPAYPDERVEYILDNAGIDVLVTQLRLTPELPLAGRTVITLEDEALDAQPTAPPSVTVTPDTLAYIIYTSGSTGQPKGVRITHRNLVHSTTARYSFYPQPLERFLLLSSFAFDSSLVGIFWTLCAGGTLCLPPHGAERDVQQIASLVQQYRVTHLLALPSLYQVLLDFADPAALYSLTTVMVAGEACPLPLVQQHYATLPDATLYNEYGPTEGTVWATAWEIPPDAKKVLIGGAIPNVQTYVLDAQQSPVPVGITGELYIGGEGIAQGYHQRPDLTADRFIDNPFGDGRLYRTGDLVRYLPDSNLEFLGRVDFQLKISGYRVELGEIETALTAQDPVREAVVLAHERDAQTQLVAFVTLHDAASTPMSAVKTALRERVPHYMVPAQVIGLVQMPRTPNGKVDRDALRERIPQPNDTQTSITTDDPIETELLHIWREILGREVPSLDADFFALGGSSLSAMRMFARIKQTFDKTLPVSLIMEAPTIAGLADALRDETTTQGKALFTLPVADDADSDAPPLYCMQVQKWGVVSYRYLAPMMQRRVVGLSLPPDVPTPDSLEGLAAYFVEQLLQAQPQPPYYLCGKSFAGLIAYEMGRQLRERGIEAVQVILFDTHGRDYPQTLSLSQIAPQYLAYHGRWLRSGEVNTSAYLSNRAWEWRFRLQYNVERVLNRWRTQLGMPVEQQEEIPQGMGFDVPDELPTLEYRGRRVEGEDALLMLMKAHYFAEPKPYAGDVVLFRAAMQSLRAKPDATLGWQNSVQGDITVIPVRGTHSDLLRPPFVDSVAQRLREWLARQDDAISS